MGHVNHIQITNSGRLSAEVYGESSKTAMNGGMLGAHMTCIGDTLAHSVRQQHVQKNAHWHNG